ncbi:hypothetical protein K493DRAFT_105448 [Basidiobolus meristosporus CBS 931.73]|uniref:Mediator of RNA polymerase II transcription subunit 1 n=1 Tax=Basidiobolus meristosporus CBS 931.73 TaxID=1314790 RepID=A0A1Y1YQU8_9FUNG|nr:hypothetical protein K493DRAFT_105448 [Basidiobolus meristosporus CBS 931.73]|eukprot:ORY00117.1 hypothetical protein K493DRAFT_105448 [Basidiobolus meristosporus CBS 931.73]
MIHSQPSVTVGEQLREVKKLLRGMLQECTLNQYTSNIECPETPADLLYAQSKCVTDGLHPYGPVNISKIQTEFSQLLASVKNILSQYKSTTLGEIEGMGAAGEPALRKLVTTSKEETIVKAQLSGASDLLKECASMLKQSCTNRVVKSMYMVEKLREIAHSLGLECYLETSNRNGLTITTATLSGSIIVVDIDITSTGDILKVKVSYAVETNQDEKVDQLLANNLKTKNIQGFKKNLSALAVLDRFANNCPQVDFPHCISSIYKDMKSIFAQEMSSSSNDIEAVLLVGHGIPLSNIGWPGPSLIYWGSKETLIDVDLSNFESWVDQDNRQTLAKFHRACFSMEDSDTSGLFLPNTKAQYLLSDQESATKVLEEESGEYGVLTESVGSLLPMPAQFLKPIGPLTLPAPARFVAWLEPPVPVVPAFLREIANVVGIPQPVIPALGLDSNTSGSPVSLQELLIKEAILACNPENASRDTIKKALDASFKWRVQMEDSKLRQRYSYVSQLSEGLVISRIPFTNPSQIFGFLQILRHHIVFNSLLQSCFNASSYSIEQENEEITLEALIQNDIDHPLMQIEISTPNPPYSIIASFAEPFTHSIVTLEINIEKHSAQPLVKRYSAMNAMEADTDVYNEEKMTKVLRTCGSIPIMVEWLFKRLKSKNPSE